MKANKIEVSKTLLNIRFLTSKGEIHRIPITLEKFNFDDLDNLILGAGISLGEEPDLSRSDLARTITEQVAALPADTEFDRFDFHCGPESLDVDDDGNETEKFNPAAFVLQAKTKDKRKKGDGKAMGVSFSKVCEESGEWIDIDIDNDPECAKIPNDFKTVYKALLSVGNLKHDFQCVQEDAISEMISHEVLH